MNNELKQEYQERLCDQLLFDKLANAPPPDLSTKILQRHYEVPAAMTEKKTTTYDLRTIVKCSVAAGVLLSVTTYLMSQYGLLGGSYHAESLIRVRRGENGLQAGHEAILADDGDYDKFKQTQAALIKSELVIRAALQRPGVRQLPMIQDKQDPVRWIGNKLRVRNAADSELISVSLRGPNWHELAQVVDAVVDSYIEAVVQDKLQSELERLDILKKSYRKTFGNIKRKQEAISQLARRVGAPESEQVDLGYRVEMDRLMRLRNRREELQQQLNEVESNFGVSRSAPPSVLNSEPARKAENYLEADPYYADAKAHLEKLRKLQREARTSSTAGPSVQPRPMQLQQAYAEVQRIKSKLRPRIVDRIMRLSDHDANKRADTGQMLEAEQSILRRELAGLDSLYVCQAGVVEKTLGFSHELEMRRAELVGMNEMMEMTRDEIDSLDINTKRVPRISVIQPAFVTRQTLLGEGSANEVAAVTEREALEWLASRKTRAHRQQRAEVPSDETESKVESVFDEDTAPDCHAGDQYAPIVENEFQSATDYPLSTCSIDVDTASYSKIRMYLMQNSILPPPDAVRLEELVNYFEYDYPAPRGDHPVEVQVEVAGCPWQPKHRLVRVGIQGRRVAREQRRAGNLVFLIDVSGSMAPANKLPLLKHGVARLTEELNSDDLVSIVVYAGAAGMVLPPTSGSDKETIHTALSRLEAGGSTAGAAGIRLAYEAAQQNFVTGGNNRVILCTDGDFNVGTTNTDELVRLVEDEAKKGILLTALGFGMGNHNDSMMEKITNKGNGNYAFIDSPAEAEKVLVEQIAGTLETIAKDVKIQVEFNPGVVVAYRQLGYENRLLVADDFNDDLKDAGEIGAGHRVTALYEIVPTDGSFPPANANIDELKYQNVGGLTEAAHSGELMTLKLRYKQPDEDQSTLVHFPVKDSGTAFAKSTTDFQFSAAVVSFGMLLRRSQYSGNATFHAVAEIANSAVGPDSAGRRAEFVEMVNRAKELSR